MKLLSILILLSFAIPAWGEPCRIGIDFGSSGLRAERDGHPGTARQEIGYLKDVWSSGTIRATLDETVAAMAEVRRQLGVPAGCPAVGGGYSAWRLALDSGGAADLVRALRELRQRTGIAILVIPQSREGTYAFHSAASRLGERLRGGTILDVGGGSLQVATAEYGWGASLGQRSWWKLFCERVKAMAEAACLANPVGETGESAARRLLLGALNGKTEGRPPLPTVTAISPPVARGIHPVLRHLATTVPEFPGQTDTGGFDKAALDAAIILLRGETDQGIAAKLAECRTGCSPGFIGVLVTDMLLLSALMEVAGASRIQVAEAEINNVAGLLADPRASAWASRHECYLARLLAQGIDAFGSDPGTCRAE